MKCFVTGASGFIGSNLVRELNARGHEVKALIPAGATLAGLDGTSYEKIEGDLLDPESYRARLLGCDWCFHLAASYHLWMRNYAPMYAVNVQGTRNVLAAAIDAGCSRIVYTSTVGCIGLPKGDGASVQPSTEDAPVSVAQMTNHYKKSKWQAEQVALELAANGAPIVIVNPTAPIGPRDSRPTPTGKVILDFLNRKMPAYVDTGLNWVHVQDVAVGHILAAEKGRLGQRYILGNASGNWTMIEALYRLEKLTGLPAPKFRVPLTVAMVAACVDEVVSFVTGKEPRAPLAGIRMARHKMFFDPSKAIRELGLPQTPPEQAFKDAVDWFRNNGYVKCA